MGKGRNQASLAAGGGAAAFGSTLPTANPVDASQTITQGGGLVLSTYPEVSVRISGAPLSRQEIHDAIKKTGLPPDIKGQITIDKRGDTIYTSFNGNGIRMDREIRSTSVYNAYFVIRGTSPYAGRSLEIFNNQVRELSAKGYAELKVSAAGYFGGSMNGYYTWLRYGYTPDASSKRSMVEGFYNYSGIRVNDHIEMMATKVGRKYWKENGFGWRGTFDLTPNSVNFRTLEQYMSTKKGKKR